VSEEGKNEINRNMRYGVARGEEKGGLKLCYREGE